MVARAIYNLSRNDPAWESNLYLYRGQNNIAQATWWLRAQVQAERGVPAMQALVNEFIAVRLTS